MSNKQTDIFLEETKQMIDQAIVEIDQKTYLKGIKLLIRNGYEAEATAIINAQPEK